MISSFYDKVNIMANTDSTEQYINMNNVNDNDINSINTIDSNEYIKIACKNNSMGCENLALHEDDYCGTCNNTFFSCKDYCKEQFNWLIFD